MKAYLHAVVQVLVATRLVLFTLESGNGASSNICAWIYSPARSWSYSNHMLRQVPCT